MNRPVGVTALGMLQVVFSILLLVGGLVALFGSDWIIASFSAQQDNSGEAIFVRSFGGALVALGLVGLWFGVALLRLKPWAWTATLVLQILGMIGNLSQLGTAGDAANGLWGGILLAGVIIYYLYRPAVRRGFGKS